MKTRAVNRRVEQEDVYIGRGSKWGNPFVIGKHGDRERVIAAYRSWLARRGDLLHQRHELRGKRLGCFCKPQACHGDVLAELAEMTDDEVRQWIDAVKATEERA